ncbi:hypothetical protein PGT21_036745 [Puccinia graminis f. sp. tritici]|nr:hypothetical protein PGT21_036745 [Puccinia graminis f. sp. tritici]
MKLSITNAFGIPMVLLLFQLLASQVACHGCDKAGQDRNGVPRQYPLCAGNVKRTNEHFSGGGSQTNTLVEFVAPPWNVDHYDCSQTDNYKTEACCKTTGLKFILSLEYMDKDCSRPDGHPLNIK